MVLIIHSSANYIIGVNGDFSLVFGTSASSPVMGAMLTAINDARIALGKKPIGFINPAVSVPLLTYSDNIANSIRNRSTRPTSKKLSTISRMVQTPVVVQKDLAQWKAGTRYLELARRITRSYYKSGLNYREYAFGPLL